MTTAQTKTRAQIEHEELTAAALAQLEFIRAKIEASARKMESNPDNWGIAGDMGATLRRLIEVTE